MTTLTEEQVKQYLNLRVGHLEIIENLSRNTLKKLKSLEEKILDHNSNCYGLPFYLAYNHHLGGKSMISLSDELSVYQFGLRTLFSYFEIPMLTKSEANKRLHSNPEFKKKQAKGIRRNAEEKWEGARAYRDTGKEEDRSKITIDIIRAYDEIITYADNVEDWRELISPVSKKIGAEPDVVRSCLKSLFKKS